MNGAESLTVLEINDSEIRVVHQADITARSPGYAVISKNGVELGNAAARSARLNPRAVQSHFWRDLNQDPLQSPTARIRHHADLAYAHLLAIHEQGGKPDEVVLAVPGHFSTEQLSLLLGLMEASPFNAIGLVDSAVAAAAMYAERGTHVHAEIHLHQTVLTGLEVTDEIGRTWVQVVPDAGMARVRDDCAAMITELFIRQSRFDPQHHAQTEQSLYDQIDHCLAELGSRAEAVIEIPYQKVVYTARLPRTAMLEALQPVYRKILGAMPPGVNALLGDRLGGLPGFSIPGGTTQTLAPDAVFQGCKLQLDHIRSSGSALNFVTRLPAADLLPMKSTAAVSVETLIPEEPMELEDSGGFEMQNPSTKEAPPVTHILSAFRAWPLGRHTLYLVAGADQPGNGAAGADCSVTMENGQALVQVAGKLGAFVNGVEIEGPVAVRVGDVLHIAGSSAEYTFINVND